MRLVFKQLVNINVRKMGQSLQQVYVLMFLHTLLTLMFLCHEIQNQFLQFIRITSATVHSALHIVHLIYILHIFCVA